MVYCSGNIGISPETKTLVEGTITERTVSLTIVKSRMSDANHDPRFKRSVTSQLSLRPQGLAYRTWWRSTFLSLPWMISMRWTRAMYNSLSHLYQYVHRTSQMLLSDEDADHNLGKDMRCSEGITAGNRRRDRVHWPSVNQQSRYFQ